MCLINYLEGDLFVEDLFDLKESQRDKETQCVCILQSDNSLPIWLQWSVLGQAESRSKERHLSVTREWLRPEYFGNLLLLFQAHW